MSLETENTESEQIETGDDDFASGLTDHEDHAPTPTPAAESSTDTPVETKEDIPKPASITEKDWADLLNKASSIDEVKAETQRKIDTIAGNLGGMKQLIEQLRQRGGVKLTPGQLKRTAAEFPELEAMLTEDLSEILASGTGGVNPEEIDQRAKALMDKELPQVVAAFEKKILRSYHRDWVDVVRSPEFVNWQKTLPQDEQDKLLNSIDGEFVADKITEFKSFKAKPVLAPRNTRQSRIEAAIPAKGTGGHAPAPDADDDFMAGLRSG